MASRLRRLAILGVALAALAGLLAALPPAGAQNRAEFVPTFSTNPRVKQQFDRLNALAAQKQWDACLAIYQQLVDDPRDLVLEKDEEFLVGARWHAHQLLAGLPVAARQRYRAIYDNEARKLFDRAQTERDGAAMREVYSRFRHSTFGPRALLWLATDAQDRGRAEYARVAFARLAKDPAVAAGTLLRYALAADSAGNPAEARAVLERLRRDYAAQPLTVGGDSTTAGAAAERLLAALKPPADGAAARWPSFAGDAGDRRMPALTPTARLTKRWEFVHPTAPDTPRYFGGQTVIIGSLASTRARFNFLSFPVAQGERLWVQGPRNVTSLDLADGKTLWDKQDFSLGADEGGATQEDIGRRGGYSYRAARPFQAAPSLRGKVLLARVAMSSGQSSGSRWPADFALAAYEAAGGRPLWRRTAGGDPKGSFFNIPTTEGNLVFTGIATNKGGITEYAAQTLDLATGEPLWTTYLGAGSDPLGALDGSPAAVRDGVVWIESSLYTLNGLDLISGEVRTVYHYDPGQRVSYGGFNSSPPLSNEAISAIAVAPKVTVDRREVSPIVFAPRWGVYVIALDSDTGRLLWSTPKAPGRSSIGSLFAVDAQRAYVCGEHVQAISLADGAPEWTWEAQKVSAGDVGFAALAGDRIYLPVEGKLVVLGAADGRELAALDALNGEGDPPGFCAVLPLGDRVVMTTRDRVVGFQLAQ
jgi:outer membrane protein assembly factor BamB